MFLISWLIQVRFGFDLDYTLALYNGEMFDKLTYDLLVKV